MENAMTNRCPVCNTTVTDEDSICSACGFKLLGSTQSFEPLAVSADDLIAKPEQLPAEAVIKVIRGPQIGMVYSLDRTTSLIGRSPQCDIFLNDMTVSRNHAAIIRQVAGYQISDTHSFNGVWINNKNIDKVLLHDDDIIQIGAFCLLYQESR